MEHSYGDIVTKTSETGIKFRLPGSSVTIDATAIHAQVKVGANTTALPDPKTIFEKPADLNAFEGRAKSYIAAKVSTLQNAVTTPNEGERITVDVSVSLVNGADAIMKIEFPWNTEPNEKWT